MSDLHAAGPRARWEAWVAATCSQLHVDPALVDIDGIHALTRAVADRLDRPMAPVASLILGAAAASGTAVEVVSDRIQATLRPTVAADPLQAETQAPADREEGHRASWDSWVAEACTATGVDPALVDIDEILAMTRVVAHRFDRPMAPVSSFILGAALACGGSPDDLRRRLEETLPVST